MKNLSRVFKSKPKRVVECLIWFFVCTAIILIVGISLKKIWPILFYFYMIIPLSHIIFFVEPLNIYDKLQIAYHYISVVSIICIILLPTPFTWMFFAISLLSCIAMVVTVLFFQ